MTARGTPAFSPPRRGAPGGSGDAVDRAISNHAEGRDAYLDSRPRVRTVDWTGTETVEPGDELAVDDVATEGLVVLEYRDRALANSRMGELREDDSEVESSPSGSLAAASLGLGL